MRQEGVRVGAIDWRYFVPAGVLSLVTMPLTALWFLALGAVAIVVSALVAASRRPEPASGWGSIGLGLLIGPAAYLVLAVIA